jgi:hypothetical protein
MRVEKSGTDHGQERQDSDGGKERVRVRDTGSSPSSELSPRLAPISPPHFLDTSSRRAELFESISSAFAFVD